MSEVKEKQNFYLLNIDTVRCRVHALLLLKKLMLLSLPLRRCSKCPVGSPKVYLSIEMNSICFKMKNIFPFFMSLNYKDQNSPIKAT